MKNKTSNGFTLSIVLILSTALMILAVALLQTVSITRKDSVQQYYTKMAEEAAEAGAAFAQSCLELSGHEQTWGSAYSGGARPNLIPSSDCDGTATAFPSHTYVYTDNYFQTRFVVGNLDESEPDSAVISVTGYTEVKQYGTSTITKTYTHVIKKTIVWQPDLAAQRSTSGQLRTCALLAIDAYCWGDNANGKLGNNSTTDSLVPVKVSRQTYPGGIGDKTILDIEAGATSTCVIIDTGEVYCWGDNTYGQLGTGNNTDSYVPTKVDGGSVLNGKVVTQIALSGYTACALIDDGDLYCWGRNNVGQVGNNSTTNRTSPVRVGGSGHTGAGALNGIDVQSIASRSGAFNSHTCAVGVNELAYCWGSNVNGEIGTGATTGSYLVPTAVNTSASSGLNGKKVISIQGDGTPADDVGDSGANIDGDAHTCALAYTTTVSDAKPYCWGSNRLGQLGNNGTWANGSGTMSARCTKWNYCYPQAVTVSGVLASKTITELAVNDEGGCVVGYPSSGTLDDRNVYCWGSNNVRGDGSTSNTKVPVTVVDVLGLFATNPVDNVVGGARRFCARTLGRAFCWGTNGIGQIGDGTTVTPRRQPTESLYLRPSNNQYIF